MNTFDHKLDYEMSNVISGEIDKNSLIRALSNKFNAVVCDVEYASEVLQGGTVGDVTKLFGQAKIQDEMTAQPFELVVKTQKKWDRSGDPGCWRREYEIYHHGLVDKLPQELKLPQCYLLEESTDVTRIWMAYVNGLTGNKALNVAELAEAAYQLGVFQAKYHLQGEMNLPYIRSFPAVHSSFDLWWGYTENLLSMPIKGFPEELRTVLNHYAAHSKEILDTFDVLPRTLCQGDVHHDNLIFNHSLGETSIYLIDWDSAGYGYMGEDAVDLLMEAFIYSDREPSLLREYRHKIIDSYCRGVRMQGARRTVTGEDEKIRALNFHMSETLIREIFVLSWGFRIVNRYVYHEDAAEKRRCLEILEMMLKEEG